MNVIEIKPIYPDILPFTVCIMRKEEIIAEKVRAILKRNYARDVFDFYFLLNHGAKLDISLINKKLKYYNETFNKTEFFKKINEQEEKWESELKPLVIGELPKFEDVRSIIKNIFKEEIN